MLGSVLISLAIFSFYRLTIFNLFFLYFWCSNFSFISPILLLSLITPQFPSSHLLLFVNFLCSFPPFSSFNSLQIVDLFPFLLIITFLWSSRILFPFPLSLLFYISFCFYYSLLSCHWYCCCGWGVVACFRVVLLCSASAYTTVYKTRWGLSLLVSQTKGVPTNKQANNNQDPNTSGEST